MEELTAIQKRAKELVHQVISKDADCRIETSENGEIVIYTGLVMNKTKYRLAEPHQQMDYVPAEELK